MGCGQTRPPGPAADFAAERERMVNEQLVRRGIHDPRVLAAMRKVPREEFVPAPLRNKATRMARSRSVTTKHFATLHRRVHDRTIATETDRSHSRGWHRFRLSGCNFGGTGSEVYTVEIIEPLAKNAQALLERLGCRNVHVKVGDGYKGWPEHASFDVIIVTCAIDHVPGPLVAQLKEGGRMMIPVGESFAQELYLFEKENDELKKSAVLPVVFVPMQREPDSR